MPGCTRELEGRASHPLCYCHHPKQGWWQEAETSTGHGGGFPVLWVSGGSFVQPTRMAFLGLGKQPLSIAQKWCYASQPFCMVVVKDLGWLVGAG